MKAVVSRTLGRNLLRKCTNVQGLSLSTRTRYFSTTQTNSIATYRFSEDHEWISEPDSEGLSYVGITDHAQTALGEIVFVELPDIESTFDKNETFGQIESVKAASELLMPVSGIVVDINNNLEDNPGVVNSSPEKDAWMLQIKVTNPTELDSLMDQSSYDQYLESLE